MTPLVLELPKIQEQLHFLRLPQIGAWFQALLLQTLQQPEMFYYTDL
jgi:hypothetical protein